MKIEAKKNPNPGGHLTAAASPVEAGEASGPSGLGPVGRVLAGWQPIATAPRDGTLLLLQIADGEERESAIEDVAGLSRTIGHNNFDNDGEDVWQFAGWCWSHDHYTEGRGKPVAWRAVPDADVKPKVPVPEGWKLVPLYVTDEMQRAYFDVIDRNMHRVATDATFGRHESAKEAYRAMLKAAPEPSQPKEPGL